MRWQRYLYTISLWIAITFLFVYAFRTAKVDEILLIVRSLSLAELGILFALNALIILFFSARWWVILRAQGYPINYLTLSAYRLSGFSVSLFTPGPHFGGEPLMVRLVQKRKLVPLEIALSSVAMDKLFELLSNFAFLAFGTVVLISGGYLGSGQKTPAALIALGLLAAPLSYLLTIHHNKKYLSRLAAAVPVWRRARGFKARFVKLLTATESELSKFSQNKRAAFRWAVILSGSVWLLLLFEYSLALEYFGLDLNIFQTISALTAARIAILLPAPGGLGVLEASQVIMMEAIGVSTALGISISLYIHGRDLVFGGIGLLLGGSLARGIKGDRESSVLES